MTATSVLSEVLVMAIISSATVSAVTTFVKTHVPTVIGFAVGSSSPRYCNGTGDSEAGKNQVFGNVAFPPAQTNRIFGDTICSTLTTVTYNQVGAGLHERQRVSAEES